MNRAFLIRLKGNKKSSNWLGVEFFVMDIYSLLFSGNNAETTRTTKTKKATTLCQVLLGQITKEFRPNSCTWQKCKQST